MTNIPSDQKTAEVWFIDSGCSNHMIGLKPVLKELNEGEKLKVELGNGKELKVEGKGTVGIETHHGNRILTNEHGIHRELTTPYTPEQNGVAERKNQTVVERARSMLQMKDLSNDFWAEAVLTSIYLLNISPTKAVMNKTPFEAWYGKKPKVSHLRVFGCISYALVPSQVRQKLDKKSEKCIFVGYCTQSKAYRLHNPLNGKILIRRDVVFDESASWDWKNNEEYVSLVDGELTNDGEQTVVESSMETVTSTPPSSTPSTPQSYHSSSSNDETSDELPSQRFRSMEDIYNSSQFALMVSDSVCYDEAASNEGRNDSY
ncbi:integrase [Cucumis melo var. makuwa]|uniref:Integrase n=1 Tax=Cucumis melo var. makuwa TaxID=1194695 RepID=A0A5D3BFW8_CUCMM|nr:integrase [Cucumis melo var. makuwa]TYJ98143.1 integrase [Cucumis melo var. makuwa]